MLCLSLSLSLSSGSSYKFRVVAMNMYGESPHSIPSKLYQVPQANRGITERPVVGPHILSTDAISDTQIMLRWTVSLDRHLQSDLVVGTPQQQLCPRRRLLTPRFDSAL